MPPLLLLGTRNRKKREEIVDEDAHSARFASNDRQQTPPFIIERGRIIFFENPRVAIDGAQGRTQIMGNRVGE